ncbi:response regulator [Magnetofaba australis]|uniref:Putative Transcriptional regulatory protein AfsQ1 n=1 Tax=Magnetofaba australis IT-1 TaxID=1434232 RepID=A0A1Y2K2X2_9PROT|nr:response regulator [Magnetofaba australis]OSM01966.1 putative Transcriptional regulatory protein AfsQ1 [Magnetofaba australis IT-1]
MNRSQPHILIVEDDSDTAILTAKKLNSAGYETTIAASGEEGVEKFAANAPDLVLMDANLPGTNGYEATERILALPQKRHVPVIMVTGMDSEDAVEQAFHSGAVEVILKPVNWAILTNRVAMTIKYYNLQRDLAFAHGELKRQMGEKEAELVLANALLEEQA